MSLRKTQLHSSLARVGIILWLFVYNIFMLLKACERTGTFQFAVLHKTSSFKWIFAGVVLRRAEGSQAPSIVTIVPAPTWR